ncbi:hypothetical protein [Microcoleus vaginatus]|uniref:hypothetical protein n=1 Tax=Microcoleus vaginatus TaxID=119532 RepID=UPI0016875BD9|nr:hypothetical protein [Microcoleus sp. FACHB-84]
MNNIGFIVAWLWVLGLVVRDADGGFNRVYTNDVHAKRTEDKTAFSNRPIFNRPVF